MCCQEFFKKLFSQDIYYILYPHAERKRIPHAFLQESFSKNSWQKSNMKGVKVDWKEIPDFPGYFVHFSGVVHNDRHNRDLTPQRNQHGAVNVGLYRDGIQHKRSVALLVAEAFLPDGLPETFDTPIHLDGDLDNNSVENLMWRPRWFAIRYQRQFNDAVVPRIKRPIQDKHTGERYRDSMHVCTTFGLLDRDLRLSIVNETTVWPTYQEFRVV